MSPNCVTKYEEETFSHEYSYVFAHECLTCKERALNGELMEDFVLPCMPAFGCMYVWRYISAVHSYIGEYTEGFTDSTYKELVILEILKKV